MFGKQCPGCPDSLIPLEATSARFRLQKPDGGEAISDAHHTGPIVVAPDEHVMIVHRGHGETVTIKSGQVISLCEGDVVRVLGMPD